MMDDLVFIAVLGMLTVKLLALAIGAMAVLAGALLLVRLTERA